MALACHVVMTVWGGCDPCPKWFWPASLCLGLPEQVAASIQECAGDGIASMCTDCRACPDGGSDVNRICFT